MIIYIPKEVKTGYKEIQQFLFLNFRLQASYAS